MANKLDKINFGGTVMEIQKYTAGQYINVSNNGVISVDPDGLAEYMHEIYGTPLMASTAAGMTDRTRIYVYTGSETGYNNGHWYYWNGSAWADGGVYNSAGVTTDKTLTLENIPADAKATGDQITDLKEDFNIIATVTKSPNLYNENDEDVLIDKYINPNGLIETVSGRTTTGFIPVNAGQKLVMSLNGFANPWSSVCFFGDNKSTVISGGAYNTNNLTVPGGAKYARVTFSSQFTKVQIECNSDGTVTEYQPYGAVSGEINEDVILPLVKPYKIPFYKKTGSLSDGQFFKSTARTDVRKNTRVVFTADITSFSSVMLAKSYNVYPDNISLPRNVFTVDETNVTYNFTGDGGYDEQIPHNLTISNNIQIIIEESNNTTCKFTLISNGNIFVHTFGFRIYENGSWFVKSVGSTLTGCEFVWMCSDIDKLAWIFGDSYCQNTADRWVYYLREYGFDKNALINAFAGEGSASAQNSFGFLLEYGTPTFAIWCIGMNDGSDSSSEPSSSWVTGRDKFINYCNAQRITPIFGTIPTVPNVNNERKNDWIRNSGYRYIDFAKAVGANSNGNWYEGMLSSDNIHPTENGARALFAQFIADFPEIMLGMDMN